MITPLKKHGGHGGALVSIFILVSAAVVVISMRRPQPSAADADAVPSRPKPAASLPAPAPPPPPPKTVDDGPLTGVVAFDETVTARAYVPVRGFLVDVRTAVGRNVKQGQLLATLYSPDVYTAELAVIEQLRNFTTQAQLDDARRKLLRWGMPKPRLAQIEKTRVPQGMLPIVAWRNGKVVSSHAVPGLYVESAELITVTDPSKVWIVAELGKRDAQRAAVGMRAKVTTAGAKKPFSANVRNLYPVAYDGTRTVRLELAAPIAPGTQVTIELAP